MSRKRSLTPSEVMPPPELAQSSTTGAVFDHWNTGWAGGSQGAPSGSQMVSGPPCFPSQIPEAPGHTVHVNLNVTVGSRELDGEPGLLLAASLRTFVGTMLLPNKRRRVRACTDSPSSGESDDVIEQPDPSISTLADHLSGLTTAETVVLSATNSSIAADNVLHATAVDEDANLIITTMDADVEPVDVDTWLDSVGANDQPMLEQTQTVLQPQSSLTQPVPQQQQTQLTCVNQVQQTVEQPVKQTTQGTQKPIWVLTVTMSQQTEPPPPMTGISDGVTPSAASAETGATPSAAT